jgi:rhamnulose-1-phosphate aldolase
MPCGTDTIGRATAEKMKTARLVLWAQHGIYAAGASLDETYGLIETAEKAAEVYLKIAHLPWKNNLTDRQLCDSAAAFGVTPRDGYLDLTEE